MDYTVNLSGVESREQLHELLMKTLPLPSYYGKNLDALYDILTEGHQQWNGTFTACEKAKAVWGAYFDNLRETFTDATEEGCAVSAVWNN